MEKLRERTSVRNVHIDCFVLVWFSFGAAGVQSQDVVEVWNGLDTLGQCTWLMNRVNVWMNGRDIKIKDLIPHVSFAFQQLS